MRPDFSLKNTCDYIVRTILFIYFWYIFWSWNTSVTHREKIGRERKTLTFWWAGG